MTAMKVRVTHEMGTDHKEWSTGVEITEGVILATIHVSDPHPQVRTLSLIVDHMGVHIPWERILKVEELERA